MNIPVLAIKANKIYCFENINGVNKFGKIFL